MTTATFPVTSEVILSFEDSNDKRFVILVQSILGPWHLPYTFIGEQETTQEAAQRLVREKLNLNIEKDRFEFLNIYDDPQRMSGTRKLATAYFHFLDEVNSVLVAKNAMFNNKRMWFDVDKLPKLSFDHAKMIEDFLKQQYPIQYSFDN